MNKRMGFIGIIIEDRDNDVGKVNEIISHYADDIIARVGIPYKEKDCSIITLIVDIDTDKLGELTGKLGAIPSVSVKSGLSKTK